MPKAHRRPAAQEAMLGLATGYWVSQLVYVAARLGIADVLARGPMTPDAIAKKVGAHAPHLRRVLRALASVGVFAEDKKGRFRSTPLAQTLRTDRPGSLNAFVRMMVDGYNWDAWGALLDGVVKGATPFQEVHGEPVFSYLRKHPEKDAEFSASMASISGTENAAVARAYPFGDLSLLVDVGGAHGHLLATVLARHKRLRGVLFDQPQVVEGAARSGFIGAAAVRARCEAVGGDFFEGVPAGADGYVMKYVLHDWDDERCVRILSNCRMAMASGGRVLAVDHVIPPGNGADWGKLLDINMMVIPCGRERTREEFRALFAEAGLRLRRVIPTACPLRVLEGVAA
jgi:hypothetical protein